MNDPAQIGNVAEKGLTLYPRKRSAIGLIVICALLVAVALRFAQERDGRGYICAVFFAIGVVVGMVQLIPGSAYLKIAAEGLTICSLFSKTLISWHDIAEFRVVMIKKFGLNIYKMVAVLFVDAHDRQGTVGRLATRTVGCEGGVPDYYGMTAEEFAKLLNDFLELFGGHHDDLDEPAVADTETNDEASQPRR